MRSSFALAILSAACLLACVTPTPEPAQSPAYAQPQSPAPQPPTSSPAPVPEPVPEPSAQAGLCSAGQTCPEGSYCRFDDPGRCGAGEGTGVCETIPQICNHMYAPVCGCDGKTHSNSCTAAGQGVNIQKPGACEAEPTALRCGGIAGILCPKGFSCGDDPTDSCDPAKGGRDCMGVCRAGPATCAPVRCKMFCKNGWAAGADGCEMCACKKL